MSSTYSPYGGAPMQVCQRCGRPLPLNEVRCGNCGYYNAPAQANTSTEQAQPSLNTPWSSAAPQGSYRGGLLSSKQWSQPSTPPPQNNAYAQPSTPPQQSFAQPSAPQQSFDMPIQQSFYSSSSPMAAGGFQPGVLDDSQIMGNRIQPEKRSPNMGIIIGSVVLLLILIGGGIAGYTFVTRHPSKSSVSATPSSPVPTTAPKGPPMFADSFTSNTNGWNLESQPGKFSVALGNGTMALEDDDNKLLWEVVPGGRTFSNFKLSVDAVLSKGTQDNGYGVYIRGALDQNGNLVTYYRFELYGDGTYAVFKGQADAHGNSTSTRIVDYTTSSAIQKQGKLNHLVITANGSSMTIAVNGQTLKVFSDNNYTSGSLALFVSNLQHAPPGAQATFSNFAIYPPQ